MRPFNVVPDVFTRDELDALEAYGDRLGASPPDAAPLPADPDIAWLHERLERTALRLNSIYEFALSGFFGPPEYLVQRAGDAGLDWTLDHAQGAEHRKLCLTLLLSDPDAYSGGDLEVRGRRAAEVAPRERGLVIAFPFYTLHRVTPVLSGVRKSVIAWVGGPRLR